MPGSSRPVRRVTHLLAEEGYRESAGADKTFADAFGSMTMKRIFFDLDETLGVPVIEGNAIVGFQVRPGCLELLERLRPRFTLCLWSVSSRRYIDKCLWLGLSAWFAETYSWDELSAAWKDVRRIEAGLLVDDSPHHREAAARHGLADRYLIVPAYGGPEDAADPTAWVRLVEGAVVLPAEDFLERAETIFRAAPVQRVRLDGPLPSAGRLASCPYLGRLTGLDIWEGGLGTPGLRRLRADGWSDKEDGHPARCSSRYHGRVGAASNNPPGVVVSG